MQSQTSPHRKTRLASDYYYYYQIHLNGPICLYAGYGEMVVTKTKGARSCEVVKETRCGDRDMYLLVHVLPEQQSQPFYYTAAIKDSEWTGQ